MRFQVPQFIEVEDKIFGPLTFKQFIYLAGGGGLCLVLFVFLPNFLAFLLSAPAAALALALAFYKVNDKPFIHILEAIFSYSTANKLYIWRKTPPTYDQRPTTNDKTQLEQVQIPRLSESKLKELTWSLDIKENQNPVTQDSDSLTNN